MPAISAQPSAPSRAPASAGLHGLLLFLTLATGLVDAASYLGMGHVLVANMTGNVVFLGFAIGGAHGFSILSSLVALAGFVIGAGLGGRLGVELSQSRRAWVLTASSIEMVLAAAAAVATAAGVLGPTGDARLALIAMLAVGLGVQNATVRRLGIPDLTTTVLTMTLTGLAADSPIAGGSNPRVARRLGSVVAMLAGGIIGAALMTGPGFTATLAVIAGVFAVSTAGFATLA